MKFSQDLAAGLFAAAAGVRTIRSYSSKGFKIRMKGLRDLVTEVDEKTQQSIIKAIHSIFPHDAILAEEGHFSKTGAALRRWVIDPIDGTTNFAHGYPCYCVSIALEEKGKIKVGIIVDPSRDHVYLAERGKGAFLHSGKLLKTPTLKTAATIKKTRNFSIASAPLQKLQVSKTKSLQDSLLVSGFTYDFERPGLDNRDYFLHFLKTTLAVRRDGSAALDLAHVAAGHFDGFWELGLKLWDYAAGILLVEEAGGSVRGLDGQTLQLGAPSLVTGNPTIAREILNEMKKVSSDGCV